MTTPPDVPEKTEGAVERALEVPWHLTPNETIVAARAELCRLRERVATFEALVREAYDAGDGDLFLPAGWLDRAKAALRETEAKEGKDG